MKQKPSVKTEPSELQTFFFFFFGKKMLFADTVVFCFFHTSPEWYTFFLKTDCGGKDTLASFHKVLSCVCFFRFGFLSTAPLCLSVRL